MIAHVDGTVSSVAPDGAVIDVGGVGLLVQCTPGTLAGLRTGERARVATSLVVREDALTPHGLLAEDERTTRQLLQTASRGPPWRAARATAATADARPAAAESADGQASAGRASAGQAADGQVIDVAVALRAALRVLGRT